MSCWTKEEVLKLNPKDFYLRGLAPDEVLRIFEVLDAGWTYQGEPSPKRAHAELASGLCSNG